jgi:hypothetical protein
MPTTYPAERGADGNAQGNADDLVQMRKEFDYYVNAWRDIHKAAENDQKALSTTGPWDDADIAERKKLGRPCIHLDQISQYSFALINEVRSNPIAIKVDPSGEGANDDTAELRAKRIRAIEYESNAQAAYQTAFESCANHSFGYFGVVIEYKTWDSDQRQIKFRTFKNSYSVLMDPDCKESDGSDMKGAFVLDRIPKDEFPKRFPDAQVTSFGTEHMQMAPAWIDDNSVQIAEYWRIEHKKRTVYWVKEAGQKKKYYADELEGAKYDKKAETLTLQDGSVLPVTLCRKGQEPTIVKRLTNGIEWLKDEGEDKVEWPGKWIPIIPVLGAEKYERKGNKVERVIESRIRKAIDGQRMFDYYKSAEAEAIGQINKNQRIGYEGQFETQTDWANINKIPTAYAEVKATTDEVPGTLLQLPRHDVYEPPIQAIEVGSESARRAMQAAVASYGYTRLDDTNIKSGIALERLKSQSDLGSYHFIDNYKSALKHAARIVNDLLDDVEGDEPMTVGLMGMDDEHSTAKINQPGEDGKPVQYSLTDDSQHEVTLSTGTSYDSQREQGAAIADALMANIQQLAQIVGPEPAAKLIGLSIQLKNAGPIGDKMVEILDPQKDQPEIPPQVLQGIQKLQADQTALNAYAKDLEGQLQEAQKAIEAKTLDIESSERIAKENNDTQLILGWLKTSSTEAIAALKEEMAGLKHTFELEHQSRIQDHTEAQAEQQNAMAERQQGHTEDQAAVQNDLAQQQTDQAAQPAE